MTTPARQRRSTTWAVAQFEGRHRLRTSLVIAALLSAYGVMFVWVGPDLVAGEELQAMLDAMPPVIVELLGFESLASLEGLLGGEYYTFGWLVGLAGYIAYTGAGSVAGDVETGRMDTLLAAPVARKRVLLGNFLALLVPIVVVNAVVTPVLYIAAAAAGESLPLDHFVALHALTVPYLLCWGAVGLLLGVGIGRSRTAGRIALALVFASWLLESVLDVTDYAWVGAVTPTRYLDPSAILIEGQYDLVGAVVLLAATMLLVELSCRAFERRDL